MIIFEIEVIDLQSVKLEEAYRAVVSAPSAEAARVLLAEYDSDSRWLSEDYATCEPVENDAYVVCVESRPL